MSTEQYLKPEVIRQVARLDLRAKFIVEGFLSGLHASPFHGFSVEFSEHRKYVPGDDPKDLDWTVYAKTGKYYIKKFQAETNLTGYLLMDLSGSMDYPTAADRAARRKGDLTKFEYAISLAAALGYLMIHQQDPVGLVTFDTKIRTSIPPHSKRTQLGTILAVLSNLKPAELTDVAGCLHQLAGFIRGKSLVMVFSDLLTEPDPVLKALYHLRHRGHEVIIFHILDNDEVHFPFRGMNLFEDVETHEKEPIDADSIRSEYLDEMNANRELYRTECAKANIDYVAIDTSVTFDKALLEYLVQRQRKF